MYKKILLVLMAVCGSAVFAAGSLELNPNHPDSYTVKRGDTLWDISGQFLSEPWRWPELWQANPQVANPNLIYPGDELRLTYKDGRPILGRIGGRNVRLAPQIREQRHEDAIQPIPIDAIQQFLSEPRVVGEDVLGAAPYVVSSEDQHLVNGAGNRVYIKGALDPNTTRYSLYRGGRVYRDPQTDAVIGYEALHVGDLAVERFGETSVARITSSSREVLNGDRVLPYDEGTISQFVPHAPESEVSGHIVSVVDGVSQIGQYQVVVLSVGRGKGIEPGHVLGIYQSGKVVNDYVAGKQASAIGMKDPYTARARDKTDWVQSAFGAVTTDARDTRRAIDERFGAAISAKYEPVELPEERAGELIVFRTFDDVSYALVMRTNRPVHLLDRVGNP
ncbi:MAG: LysM peptidoglycan-binding domain-containing protein [Gammaproteobacteria bacterium]